MILVDTSVFVEFFKGAPRARLLASHIENDLVVIHPLVEIELMLGGLNTKTMDLIMALPRCEQLDLDAIKEFISARKVALLGLGYVDTQLLASAISASHEILTFDKNLTSAVRKLIK